MRVLWICDLIFKDFCEVYEVDDKNLGGWMSGMLNAISHVCDYEIGCCFPIYNEKKMIEGEWGKWKYYSFHALRPDEYRDEMIKEFSSIYCRFKPDIIHIWGTEYAHSLGAILAAEELGIQNRVVVHIQGLVSVIPGYYMIGIPEHETERIINGGSILDECRRFERQGENEKKIFSRVKTVLGRTSWDKAYIESFFCSANYLKCDEILRNEIYSFKTKWEINKCKRNQIFISQAFYPLKGLHLILPAIAMLRREYEDLKVVVGGINPLIGEDSSKWTAYGTYLHSLIDQYGLSNVVHFVGILDTEHMIRAFLESHVYVNCSMLENSSNSIGEAQVIGTPVVAAYTGGNPDIVEHGKSGLLYQMDAPYMFMSCVKRIFDDDEYAEYISENEKTIAMERYCPEKVCFQLQRIYSTVINYESEG